MDLKTGRYTVARAVANVDKKIVIKGTKTAQSQRTSILPALALHALREHRRLQAKRRLDVLGLPIAASDDFVFDRYATGVMWDPNELSRQWSRLVQRKKLPHLRFHDLRHGTACLLLQAGCSLSEVSDTLGHTSIAVTKAFYARYEEGLKRNRAAAFDALFDGSPAISRNR